MDATARKTSIEQAVEVPVAPDRAFELYTAGIDRWWRKDSRYWNDKSRRLGLRFEPFAGGRFIEVYDATTGEGLEIGRITAWEPGLRLAYTWREAEWARGEITQVEVTFTPTATGTQVHVRHYGWETLADPALADGYDYGLAELLSWFREAAAA
jgi:uncharacterized protein YndB with AHSA1/START domain